GDCRDMVFGINSPNTTCMKVTRRKAIVAETECRAMVFQGDGKPAKTAAKTVASAPSATQPSPRLASVMPSCVVAIVRSRFLIALASDPAPATPCATSSSTRVFRTATIENSAATKNAFSATRAGILMIPRAVQTQSPSTSATSKSSGFTNAPILLDKNVLQDNIGGQETWANEGSLTHKSQGDPTCARRVSF